MHPKRRQRLISVAFIFSGAALTVAIALTALNNNINLFYPPDAIVRGEAPVDTRIRAGGMVKAGSVVRDSGSLRVDFIVSDLAGADVPVVYEGILPDLFREGQGIVATGRLGSDGIFVASEVLAKHDENYMPPELAGMQANAGETDAGEGGGAGD
ncbi:MAG: cytochrome c maturation protein CcmE [Pseudomonadales bacterium]|nr:cytochrome c maturation protein CcmE [Pseudomonadales bacterium]